MRHWMVNPAILCRKHLIAENVEAHMFISSIKKGISMAGYLRNNLLEPLSLVSRHDAIATEMIRRGYNHNSPVVDFEVTDYIKDPISLNHKVDSLSAFHDLLTRCPTCKNRYLWYVKNGYDEITSDIESLFKIQDWFVENIYRYGCYRTLNTMYKFKLIDHQIDPRNNYDKLFMRDEYYFDYNETCGGILDPSKDCWEDLTDRNFEFLKLKVI